MLIEKCKKYVTLLGNEYDLDLLDDQEFEFLRHLEQRSELPNMDYAKFTQALTIWNHAVYKGRKPAEIAHCPVYKIGEDLGYRLGIRNGELGSPSGKEISEEDALNLMKPTGIVSSVALKIIKVNAKISKKSRWTPGRIQRLIIAMCKKNPIERQFGPKTGRSGLPAGGIEMLSEALGLTTRQVSRYLSGERIKPNVEKLLDLIEKDYK